MNRLWLRTLLVLLLPASAAAQGFNYGGTSSLSWSRDADVHDTPPVCGITHLYVRLAKIHEVKGCEFGLTWTPTETAAGFQFLNANFPVSDYGTCTWLLRNSVVTVIAQPDNGSSYAIAAAASGVPDTSCTTGAI